MGKILKWGLGVLILIIIAGVVYGWSANESKPIVNPSPEADALAQKMLTAINNEAWSNTAIIQWTFRGSRHFLWDKNAQMVEVKWEENRVLLNTTNQTGSAFVDGNKVTGEKEEELLKEAWSAFCNDSFWLNAPAKVFDEGTTRSIVTLGDGRSALYVEYASGGTTPGDGYAWLLDNNGLPTSYKMWVSIIPIGGLEVTWENWTTLATGARLAQNHKGAKFEIPITNIKGAVNWQQMNISNPF